MITVHEICASNEMPVAERLRSLISDAWPGVAENPRDKVDILVGVHTPVDVDILVILDLDRPRDLPPVPRRDGGLSAAATVQRAIIAIEVKQVDSRCLARVGNQLYATYGLGKSRRSVARQARDAVVGVRAFAERYALRPFVYAIAWLTEADDGALRDIEPLVVGATANWFTILDAASQQNASIHNIDDPATLRSVEGLRNALVARRIETNRDRARIDKLTRDLASQTVVNDVMRRLGSAQVCLSGRGGSGKTTSLALLAVRLAETGQRVLILTFHRTLRADIAHLIAGLSRTAAVRNNCIQVETTAGFLIAALDELGVDMPRKGAEADYAQLDRVLDETRQMMTGDADTPTGDAARIKNENPERFAWDYVFIDEAQDWSDSERDFLRALYGHKRLALADGIEQLVRRQTRCDWNAGIPAGERSTVFLNDSLRMLRNVATFANCVAQELGLETWRVEPRGDLPGGRIIIVEGDIATPEFARALVTAAGADKANAVDCLVCVPHSTITEVGGNRHAAFAAAAQSAGLAVWDATDPAVRSEPITNPDAVRVVQYSSCRGLEGWITVCEYLDDFYANKVKYPNLQPGDDVSEELVAKRSLLIPLTRAVHTLVISLREPASPVADVLRRAADSQSMPSGVVEWIGVDEAIARLGGQAVASSRQ